MALPQTVDPSTLNLSGKPAIATAPTTTTSPTSVGMPSPTIAQEKSNVSPLLGALFGGALGLKYASSQAGKTGTGTSGAQQQQGSNILGDLIKAITGKGTASGNIGSVNNVIVPSGMSGTEAQNWLNQNYGMTNGQPNYVVSGTNLSTGEIVGLPNYNIGPNYGGGTSTGGGSTGSLTNIGNNYFMDDNSNVYDANGNLIYQNPSNISGSQTEPSGGGYDSTQDQYFQTDAGDIYDGLGNLVLAFNNGYYYEPDTGNFYDSTTFEPVGSDFNAYTDYFNIPTLDTSGYDNLGDYFDYGNYTSGSTTYIKDGGSVNKSGLPTPLFANGGGVKGYADGSLIDAATAMAPSTALGSSTPTTTSTAGSGDTSGSGSILNSILSFAQNNPALTGAGLGALLTQLINSSSSYPVNKGVDMTALSTFKPRTTPTGPARFVPYSEYGTPTTPYDYSKLYENLGVSPFGGGVVSPTPTSATPTPTTPTSALSGLTPVAPRPTTPVVAPSGSVTAPTTTTPTAPTYYSDADGNIYDADGNLVYDTTTGSTTASAGTAVAPTTPTSGLAVPSLPTTTVADASYSYGTPVSPSDVLGSKKGGLAVKKMADGGMSDLAVTSLSDVTSSPAYDYPVFNPKGGVAYDAETGIATDVNGNIMDVGQFVTTYGTHPSNFTPDFLYDLKQNYVYPEVSIEDAQPDGKYYTMGETAPLPYERVTTTDFTPVMYNQGMPVQTTAMPTQGPLMPQQGSAMPQQTPFSSSPTFRYSGLNNPLLRGLSTTPTQPYTLAQGGSVDEPHMADGGFYTGYRSGFSPPRGMTAKDQLAMSSGMYGSVPYSSGVVSSPSTTLGPRPISLPIRPSAPTYSPTQYLNKQYLDTWQKSFPGFRAPSLDGKGSYGSPFMATLGGIYGKPYSMGGQPTTENLNVPVSEKPFSNVPEIQGRGDYRQGSYVEGAGDGQSDDIPAMLADGEYVIDAETVAQLGNGSNKAGAKVLDEFRKNIRAHKRSAPHDKIPPKSKSALAYLKGAK